MKHRNSILLVTGGLLLGLALGRLLPGTGTAETEKQATTPSHSLSATPPGSRTIHQGHRVRNNGSNPSRGPATTIRQVARKLKLSSMFGTDYDALFDAYESIRGMSPEEIQVALNALENDTASPQVRMNLQMMLINCWAKQDGQGAMEYATALKMPMAKTAAIMGGLVEWSKNDPENAYAWYQENRNKLKGGIMGRGTVDGIFFASIAQRDMKKAFTCLKDLNKSEQRNALMIMSHGSLTDPESRQKFIHELEQMEDKSLRRDGMTGVINQWALQDPQGAVEFVESREWEDGAKQIRETLARTWAQVDPKAALDWSLSTPEGQEDPADTVASQFPEWLGQDSEAATEWLQKQPEELLTDNLFERTSDVLRRNSEYAQSAQWAEQIESSSTRSRQLASVYRDWKQNDEQQALEWFDGLDASTQAEAEGAPELTPHEIHATAPVEVEE